VSRSDHSQALPTIGWREWLALPELGLGRIKAKIDTGARSSALHAREIRVQRQAGLDVVRFVVYPLQHDQRQRVVCQAALIDERLVRNSAGEQSLRPVVRTEVELLGRRWTIELSLAGRDEMGFRMLLEREAIRGRLVVDPGRSFLTDRADGYTR